MSHTWLQASFLKKTKLTWAVPLPIFLPRPEMTESIGQLHLTSYGTGAQIQEAAAADPATETSSQLWSCTSINEMAEEWNRWECPGHLGTPHNHYAHVLVGTAASCPTSAASRGKAEHMPRGHGTSTAALQGWENQAYRFNYINQRQKKPPFIHFAIESPRCSLLKLTNSSVPSCYPWPLGLPCHHCSHSQWAKVQRHPKGGGFSSRGYIRASFL